MFIGLYNVEAETPEGETIELASELRQRYAANLARRLGNENGDEFVRVRARLSQAVFLVRDSQRGFMKHVAYQAST